MNLVYAIAVINYSYIGMVPTRTLQILYCASPYNSTICSYSYKAFISINCVL